MKRRLLLLTAPAFLAAAAFGQYSPASAQPELPPPPVPIYPAPPPPPPAPPPTENQQLYGPARASLVDPQTAQAILTRYRAAYPGARIAIYVNRQLVDTSSGLQLTGRSETTSTTTTVNSVGTTVAPGGTQLTASVATPNANGTVVTTVNGTNQYAVVTGESATLSDRQTVRDIERLFGRVFRNGGSPLVDSRTASDLFVSAGATDQATRDRALSQVADIAVEVLISTKTVQVASVSGDTIVTAPDIQATAIRLKDSAIIGQASATDVLGRHPELARRFGPPDIIEATALALVEDMLTGR